MCLYPKLIKNRKYLPNKKNGGVVPPVADKRTLVVPVGCGKCMECCKQKSRQWRVRLMEELKHNKTKAHFVTLTFSNEELAKLGAEIQTNGYERDNEIATLATRRFLERWRKKYKKSAKHWLITEIGHNGTENIHMHGIIWTNENPEEITKIWGYGYTWMGKYVNEATINYIIKYITKKDNQHTTFQAKILSSPGIGKDFMKRSDIRNHKYKPRATREEYVNKKGYKMAMPIYYKNKLYTEEEREKLWLEKLDQKVRYVGGEKVNVSKNMEKYYKAREYYRKQNARLGYGNDEKNWKIQEYEIMMRNLNYLKRIGENNEENNKKNKDRKVREVPLEVIPAFVDSPNEFGAILTQSGVIGYEMMKDKTLDIW